MSEIEEEEKKQIAAFRDIVRLRAEVKRLELELEDLRRRAIHNVQLQVEEEEKVVIKSNRQELVAVGDTAQLLVLAREKFLEFDTNKSGFLDGDEMLILADWIWNVFSETNQIRRVQRIEASNDLISKFDNNNDGRLDFEEFAEWFLTTVNHLKQLAKNKKTEQLDVKNLRSKLATDEEQNQIPRGSELSQTEKLQAIKKAHKFKKRRDEQSGQESPVEDDVYANIPGLSARAMDEKEDQGATKKQREPWKKLQGKYTRLARNSVQLFLRLDRSNQNHLGSNQIMKIMERCGIHVDDYNHVNAEILKKFGSEDGRITLEQFVDFLPPNADEKIIHMMITDIVKQRDGNNSPATTYE